jgi:hypothetical protein
MTEDANDEAVRTDGDVAREWKQAAVEALNRRMNEGWPFAIAPQSRQLRCNEHTFSALALRL